jgi:hypothetical protein
MARGLRQPASEPELEFVPEQEQDLEFVPEAQDGNLTKAQYIASGGKPEDVISPEREAVLRAETQRQLQAGATPEQAAQAAGEAVLLPKDSSQPNRHWPKALLKNLQSQP